METVEIAEREACRRWRAGWSLPPLTCLLCAHSSRLLPPLLLLPCNVRLVEGKISEVSSSRGFFACSLSFHIMSRYSFHAHKMENVADLIRPNQTHFCLSSFRFHSNYPLAIRSKSVFFFFVFFAVLLTHVQGRFVKHFLPPFSHFNLWRVWHLIVWEKEIFYYNRSSYAQSMWLSRPIHCKKLLQFCCRID